MRALRAPPARKTSARGVPRSAQEDLDGAAGSDVVVAHEADQLAAGQLLDLAADVGLQDAPPPPPHDTHGPPSAGVHGPLLAPLGPALSTKKTPFSPSVVCAFVGPRPVVRASALTTVVEIFAASAPSGHWRSLLIAALRSRVPPRSRGLDRGCDLGKAYAGDWRRAGWPTRCGAMR